MERKSDSPRADRRVKAAFPGLTGRQIEEALKGGLVTLPDGRPLAKGARGDEPLDFSRLAAHLTELARGNAALALPVVAEEPDFVVIDKPAGMQGHPLSLFDTETVTHWALARYPEIGREFPEIQPTLTPHRLDTGTSGLLVVARTRTAFDRWRERFRRKQVAKKYLAWCWGEPREDRFEIALAIAHAPGEPGKMVTPATTPRFAPPVLEAQSLVRVVAREKAMKCFLAEVSCHSGVTHQVRVHLASRGFPLLGDSLYDANFEGRVYRGRHHLLRAIELFTEGGVWRADLEDFRALPSAVD